MTLDLLIGLFTDVVNWLISALGTIFGILFFWLPDDPLANTVNSVHVAICSLGEPLNWLNWFIDVPFFINVFFVVLTALTIYYGFNLAQAILTFAAKLKPW